ncbi:hypothetical protein ACGFYY_40060 [Streptomyces sp. NPDC048331]|uniref:hypothetical protein n=1 Tax=Streptomyces sp. NPDC048331 TaxID=3365534 RepID=UPI003720F62A
MTRKSAEVCHPDGGFLPRAFRVWEDKVEVVGVSELGPELVGQGSVGLSPR